MTLSMNWLCVRQMMRGVLLSLVAGVMVVSLMPGHVGAQVDASQCTVGHELMYDEDYQGAIDAFTRCLKVVDLSAETKRLAHHSRGLAWRSLGEHKRALQDFDRAIEFSVNPASAYLARGREYLALGNETRALRDFDAAIAADPADHSWPDDAAWALLKAGTQLDAALAYADEAARLNPGRALAHSLRGHLLAALDRRQEALLAYDQAMTLADQYLIKSYQRKLQDLGYFSGDRDGIYGSQVEEALAACVMDGCTLLPE